MVLVGRQPLFLKDCAESGGITCRLRAGWLQGTRERGEVRSI